MKEVGVKRKEVGVERKEVGVERKEVEWSSVMDKLVKWCGDA